jgi:hypothetical protein
MLDLNQHENIFDRLTTKDPPCLGTSARLSARPRRRPRGALLVCREATAPAPYHRLTWPSAARWWPATAPGCPLPPRRSSRVSCAHIQTPSEKKAAPRLPPRPACTSACRRGVASCPAWAGHEKTALHASERDTTRVPPACVACHVLIGPLDITRCRSIDASGSMWP